jgi:hypothetical protein
MTSTTTTTEPGWLVLLYLSGTSAGQRTLNRKILECLEKATDGLPLRATCLYQFSKSDKTIWGTILDDGKPHVLYTGDPIDISDPRCLTKFIDWAIERTKGPLTPAPRVALFVKDDATGWQPEDRTRENKDPFGILFNGIKYMSLPGLCAAVQNTRGRSVDVYGFDGCNMGSLETAYEVRDVARIMIAGNTVVDKRGFAYGQFLAYLRNSGVPPGVDEAARKMVRLTKGNSADQGIFGVHLKKVGPLAEAVDALGRVLQRMTSLEIVGCLKKISRVDDSLVLTSLLSAVKGLSAEALAAVAAVRNLLADLYVSKTLDGNGLTVFIPLFGSQYFTFYGSLAFGQRFSPSTAKLTWSQFLSFFNRGLLAELRARELEPSNSSEPAVHSVS